jgi:DNA integrity scanning protein DisA with diadenylate cyclase activity
MKAAALKDAKTLDEDELAQSMSYPRSPTVHDSYLPTSVYHVLSEAASVVKTVYALVCDICDTSYIALPSL